MDAAISWVDRRRSPAHRASPKCMRCFFPVPTLCSATTSYTLLRRCLVVGVLRRVLRRCFVVGSEEQKGSQKCLERSVGEYDPRGVCPNNASSNFGGIFGCIERVSCSLRPNAPCLCLPRSGKTYPVQCKRGCKMALLRDKCGQFRGLQSHMSERRKAACKTPICTQRHLF